MNSHVRTLAIAMLYCIAGWLWHWTTLCISVSRQSSEQALHLPIRASNDTLHMRKQSVALPEQSGTAPPQEEAARERLEGRRRRQARFLHKKRRPRKVERKVSKKQRLFRR